MRFLLALDNFSRGSGGAPRSAQDLARALLARGHRVHVLETGARAGRQDWNGAELRRVRLHGPLLPGDRDLRTLVLNPRWRRATAAALAELRPDLVAVQGMLAPGALEAAAAAGVGAAYLFRGYAPLCPVQFERRDPERPCPRPRCWRCLRPAQRLKYPLVRAALELYARTVPRAELIVANSRYVAGVFERLWGVRAEVVHPALNLAPAAAPENDPAGELLFVKPQRIKGLGLFLELARAMPARRFAVAGEPAGAAARALAGRPNVQALGWRQDMGAVYRSARLLLGPARGAEPFGRVYAEAAAVGCPAVAFRSGGIPEAVGAGGVLLPPEAGAQEWQRAVERLDDPQRYEELRRAALEHARALAAEDGAGRLADLLESAARAGCRRPVPAPPAPDRKLRVVHVISALPLGGAELSVFHLVSRLSRERFEVEVVCTREEGALAGRFREAGVPVTLLELPSRYSPRGLWRLSRLLARRGADIVHTHMRRANTSGRIAAWLAGVPVIIAHERNLPFEKSRRHFLADRLLGRLSARVIAVSPQVAEAERRGSGLPREKFAVMPNALDLAEFRPEGRAAARAALGLADEDFAVGFAARLHPVKNPDVLVRAAAEAAGEVPRLRLLLAGDGPERARLEALAAETGLAGRAVFLGERRDMPAVYPAFDVLCLPSHSEGCSRALLEGAACGLPLVATPVGYAPEMLGRDEAGLLVPVGDAAALARAIVRLAREPDTRARLGRAALRRAQEHDLTAYVARVECLYINLFHESDISNQE